MFTRFKNWVRTLREERKRKQAERYYERARVKQELEDPHGLNRDEHLPLDAHGQGGPF